MSHTQTPQSAAHSLHVHCRHFLYTQHPCSRTNSSFLAHKHTHTFNGPLSGTTQVSWYQKVKPIWILLEQETVSGSGISWAICKSTHRSRQITTPAPHHSVFYRPDALPAAQPTALVKALKKVLAHKQGMQIFCSSYWHYMIYKSDSFGKKEFYFIDVMEPRGHCHPSQYDLQNVSDH